jgi:hypothetical protein
MHNGSLHGGDLFSGIPEMVCLRPIPASNLGFWLTARRVCRRLISLREVGPRRSVSGLGETDASNEQPAFFCSRA